MKGKGKKMDFLKKKKNKGEEEKQQFEEESKLLLKEMEELQVKHKKRVSAVLEYTENAIKPAFRISHMEEAKTDLVK